VGQRSKGRIIPAIQTTQISSSYYWRANNGNSQSNEDPSTLGFQKFSETNQLKGNFALLHKATKPDVQPKIARYKSCLGQRKKQGNHLKLNIS
jgi:hypothetical protein